MLQKGAAGIQIKIIISELNGVLFTSNSVLSIPIEGYISYKF
jgi:hypothetical protein